MELQFQKTPISYLQCVLRKSGTQEECTEIIVPDRMPDIVRILNTNACICMREKECRQGSAAVNGGIRAVVLYLGETDDVPQKLEAYVPFSVRVDNSDISENSDVLFQAAICSVEATMIHSRKVKICATLRYYISAYAPKTDDLYRCEQMPNGFQSKEASFSLLLPAAYAERSFAVTDGLLFPASDASLDSVIFVNTAVDVTEKRIAGNKAVFKGTVDCLASFLGEGGRYSSQLLQIPFSQFCEMSETFDDSAVLNTVITVSDCSWETATNPNSLEINAVLTAQCMVSKPVIVAVTEDAYCLNCNFEPQWKQYAFDTRLDLQTQSDSVRAFMEAEVREVMDAKVFLSSPLVQFENGTASICVPSVAEILYRDEDNQLQCGRLRHESVFSCEMNADATVEPEATLCSGVSAVPTGNGIEVRYSVCLSCESFARWTQSAIVGGEMSERTDCNNQQQLVAKRVDGRQDLWDIAKSYDTTVDRIQKVNGLENTWFADGVLLIPTERM